MSGTQMCDTRMDCEDSRLTIGSSGPDRNSRLKWFRDEFGIMPVPATRATCGHRTILIEQQTGFCFACVLKRRANQATLSLSPSGATKP